MMQTSNVATNEIRLSDQLINSYGKVKNKNQQLLRLLSE